VSLGPLLVALVACLYKTIQIGHAMAGWSPAAMAAIALADLPFLAFIAMLAAIARSSPGGVRALVLSVALVANLLYIVDAWALTTLNNHLTLDRVIVLASDPTTLASFLNLQQGALVVLVVAAHVVAWWGRGPTARPALAAVTVGVVGALAGQWLPGRYGEYGFPPRAHLAEVDSAVVRAEFDAVEIAAARAWLGKRPRVKLPKAGSNLVLVIVESLSTRDSLRSGGFSDMVPRLDAISKNGVLFPNAVANYDLSEGGIIALLSGVAPIPFPRAGRSLFRSFGMQDSVVGDLAAEGYATRVVSAFSLKFQDMSEYLKAIGVDESLDGDTHPLLKDAPRFVLGAPSDEALVNAGLADVDMLAAGDAPYLLVLMTATSHPPWTDPRGVKDDSAVVWAFVDEQLERLYRGLEERKFFDDGILIVMGDHRQASVVNQDELNRFGQRAHALTPLVVIGAGIPRGIVDRRFVQQADVFRVLGDIADPAAPLSPMPVNVKVHTSGLENLEQVGLVEVFPEKSEPLGRAYLARVYGAYFEWMGEPPADAAAVERQVQAERAVHQDNATKRATDCPWDVTEPIEPDDRPGMLVGNYDAVRKEPHRLVPRAAPTVQPMSAALGAIPQSEIRPGAVSVARAFLRVPAEGTYSFQVAPGHGVCVRIDGIPVVRPDELWWNTFSVLLSQGMHELTVIRPAGSMGNAVQILWRGPGLPDYVGVPTESVLAPVTEDGA